VSLNKKRALAAFVISAALALSVEYGSAQYLSGSDRADFIKGVVNGCIVRKDMDPQMASVPLPLYTSYCSCYADRLADRAQMSDLGGGDPKVMNPAIAEAAKPCYDDMRKAADAK
jgi:hypothetical protein